jgi:hypothetical protein
VAINVHTGFHFYRTRGKFILWNKHSVPNRIAKPPFKRVSCLKMEEILYVTTTVRFYRLFQIVNLSF